MWPDTLVFSLYWFAFTTFHFCFYNFELEISIYEVIVNEGEAPVNYITS